MDISRRKHPTQNHLELLVLGQILDNCSDLSQLLDVFHMLFDANQVGITIIRTDGTIIYYNDAQARLDGLSPKDTLGKAICDVYNFTPGHSPTMRATTTGKPVFDSVHYYRTRHGRLVNSANSIYPLWANGVLLGAICFIQSYSVIGRHIGFLQESDESTPPETSLLQQQTSERSHYMFSSLIGESPLLLEAAKLAQKVCQSSSSVMLVGETGVGKEIFAQAIHYEGYRRSKPYTAINCSALPETLLEGILFGTTKGAFTGAVNRQGLFEATNGGTLYLDEIDSMPISLQNKLLRVLQERKVRRVGEGKERSIDVRIISSVGTNPVTLVEDGLLRRDFYYRLGVVKIQIPPLRSRPEDIHLLVQHFVKLHSERLGIPIPLITPEAMAIFYSHTWPGNVRELEHAIEASLSIVEAGDHLEPSHLYRAVPDFNPINHPDEATTPWLAFQDSHMVNQSPDASENQAQEAPYPPLATFDEAAPLAAAETNVPAPAQATNETGGIFTLSEQTRAVEASSIEKALRTSAGNVAMAARLLGISPQLMHYKMKKYGIAKNAFIPGSL